MSTNSWTQVIGINEATTPSEPLSRHARFRKYLHDLLDDPSSSIGAKVYLAINMLLIVTTIIILILDSYTLIERTDEFLPLDAAITSFFTIEYILRFYSSVDSLRSSLRFIANPLNIADILSIIPFYVIVFFTHILHLGHNIPNLDALRVLRLFRLLKLTQHSNRINMLTASIKKSFGMLASILYFMFIIVLVSSSLQYYAERGTLNEAGTTYLRPNGEPSPFSSIPASMWWSIVTLVTLGYGDMVPITPLGKIIASVTMILGVLIIALPSMIIGKAFSDLQQNKIEQMRKTEYLESMTSNQATDTDFKQDLNYILERQKHIMKVMETLMTEMEQNSRIIEAIKSNCQPKATTEAPLEDIEIDNDTRL